MKLTCTIILAWLLALPDAFCIKDRVPAGGGSQGMGGCGVAIPGFWTVVNNPAGLAGLSGIQAGISFDNRFQAAGLNYEQIGVVVPVRPAVLGLALQHFGDSRYREFRASLGCALRLGRRIHAAAMLDYLRMHISGDYGQTGVITCEFGLLYLPGNRFRIGLHILNPVPLTIVRSPTERLPATLCTGLAYQFNEELCVTTEICKDLLNPLILRGGLEYWFARKAALRLGASTGPPAFTFGCGFTFGRFSLDLGSAWYQLLGFTTSGSLVCSFN